MACTKLRFVYILFNKSYKDMCLKSMACIKLGTNALNDKIYSRLCPIKNSQLKFTGYNAKEKLKTLYLRSKSIITSKIVKGEPEHERK